MVDSNVYDLSRHRFTMVVKVFVELIDINKVCDPEVAVFWAYEHIINPICRGSFCNEGRQPERIEWEKD